MHLHRSRSGEKGTFCSKLLGLYIAPPSSKIEGGASLIAVLMALMILGLVIGVLSTQFTQTFRERRAIEERQAFRSLEPMTREGLFHHFFSVGFKTACSYDQNAWEKIWKSFAYEGVTWRIYEKNDLPQLSQRCSSPSWPGGGKKATAKICATPIAAPDSEFVSKNRVVVELHFAYWDEQGQSLPCKGTHDDAPNPLFGRLLYSIYWQKKAGADKIHVFRGVRLAPAPP